MKHFIFILLILISIHQIQANDITITGKVQTNEGEALPYCHITVSDLFGTISNSEGNFFISIPDSMFYDTLKASHIGFMDFSIKLSEIPNTRKMLITLKEDRLLVDKIIVSPVSPKAIIDSMLNHRFANVDTGLTNLSVFFREQNKIKEKHYHYAEGFFNVYRNGYREDIIELERARLLRKIDDEPMPKHFIGIADSFKIVPEGNPYHLLNMEKSAHHFFSEKNLKRHVFEISGIVTVGNEKAYLIKFEQKSRVRKQLYRGSIIVTKQNYALVSMELEYSPKGSKYIKSSMPIILRKLGDIKMVNFSTMVSYSKKGDKWYPYYISREAEFSIKTNIKSYKNEFIWNTKAEILSTKVDTNAERKINRDKVISKNFDFSNYQYNKDDQDWSKYNQIIPEKELKEYINTMP